MYAPRGRGGYVRVGWGVGGLVGGRLGASGPVLRENTTNLVAKKDAPAMCFWQGYLLLSGGGGGVHGSLGLVLDSLASWPAYSQRHQASMCSALEKILVLWYAAACFNLHMRVPGGPNFP